MLKNKIFSFCKNLVIRLSFNLRDILEWK